MRLFSFFKMFFEVNQSTTPFSTRGTKYHHYVILNSPPFFFLDEKIIIIHDDDQPNSSGSMMVVEDDDQVIVTHNRVTKSITQTNELLLLRTYFIRVAFVTLHTNNNKQSKSKIKIQIFNLVGLFAFPALQIPTKIQN